MRLDDRLIGTWRAHREGSDVLALDSVLVTSHGRKQRLGGRIVRDVHDAAARSGVGYVTACLCRDVEVERALRAEGVRYSLDRGLVSATLEVGSYMRSVRGESR